MTVTFLTSRTLRGAAKLRLAARYASEYHGASGYERGRAGVTFVRRNSEGVPACEARFSRPVSTICSGGDR